MKEHLDLIRAWRALPAGTEAVLATVVAARGSVYRRPGARMLMTRDGWLAGSVSGGCVESDLLQTAFDRTANGPEVVTYDALAPEDLLFGFGLGCNGAVDVLLQRLPPDGGALALIQAVAATRRGCWIATDLGTGASESFTHERPLRGFVERIEPPHPLVIFGAGHDAVPLARQAKALGWHVTVVDSRAAYACPDRFPDADRILVAPPAQRVTMEAGTSAVVMTHNFAHDAAILRWVEADYLGVLGPRSRTQRLLEETGRFPEEIRGPIGLDLGAETPEEIAVAIVAEILAWRRQCSAVPLNGRSEPLHPR
ncbi:MAG: XdhC family protein [Fimbriimonas sp.]